METVNPARNCGESNAKGVRFAGFVKCWSVFICGGFDSLRLCTVVRFDSCQASGVVVAQPKKSDGLAGSSHQK